MKQRWKQRLAGVTAALLLTTSAAAVGGTVRVNGQLLTVEEGWIEDGTSYITLAAFARETGRRLSWDGHSAHVQGAGLELSATLGEHYVESNDRGLYVEDGVPVVHGRAALPLRVLAQASGGQLQWDGNANTAEMNTRSATPPQASYDPEELHWLARIISAESRGEPLLGQIAVGNVVLNRVASHQFPNTVRDVIFDARHAIQFEPVENGTIHHEPTSSAVLAAKISLEGASVVGDSLYFFAPALSPGRWIRENRTFWRSIGCHDFYL